MKSFGRNFLKYKLHHVLFWMVYYVGWIQVYRNYYESLADLMLVTLVYGVSHALLYYIAQYALIPRFWKKRQPLKFILAFTVLLLASAVFMYIAIRAILGDMFLEAFDGAVFPWFVFFGTSNVFWVTLMLSVKAMIDNYRGQRANERKEKERLESESQFLKAQVNPHFLFNTIIDFLKSLAKPPLVIFTTAYPNYALQGFELDVVDYLVKPYPFDRFLKAVNKARDLFMLKSEPSKSNSPAPEFMFVKTDSRLEKVIFSEILLVEAMENYVIIHTQSQKIITMMTMKAVEEVLSRSDFLRVHKSFIVNHRHVSSIEGNEIKLGHTKVPISRKNKSLVLARLTGQNKYA